MQHLEGSSMPILYTGRTVLKGNITLLLDKGNYFCEICFYKLIICVN